MFTTFSCRPQATAVRTSMDTARRLPPAYNYHSVTVPSGKSWAGPQRSNGDATLKSCNKIQVIDLTADDKSNEPRANGCVGHARDKNDDSIDDFPPLEEILRKAVPKGDPSPKRKTAEPIYNSNPEDYLDPAAPNSENGDGDDSNRPIVDGRVHDANRTSGGSDTCDLSGNTLKSWEDPSSRPTSGVRNQTELGDDGNEYEDNDNSLAIARDRVNSNKPTRSPKDRACAHSLPHDKTSNEARPSNRDGMGEEPQRLTLTRNNSLHSSAEEQVDNETSKEKTFSDVCIGSPTEVATNDDLCADYHCNDEGVDEEFGERQEDKLQQKPSGSVEVPDTDRPTLPVSITKENGIIGTRSQQSSTSPDVPATEPSDGMDYVSRLSKKQQAQYAPLKDKSSLRDTSVLPQQIPKPKKRSRSPRPPPACSSNTPLLNSKPVLQVNPLKGNIKARKLAGPIIHNGREVCVGDYVFVKCEGEDNENQPPIARVDKIRPNGQLGVLWAYHPSSPEVPKGFSFGRYEILLSDHKDIIKVECLMGFAEVEENCQNCHDAPHWCWNKRFKVVQMKIIPSERQAKRRRLGA